MNSRIKSPLRVLATAGILVSCQGTSENSDSPAPYSLGLSHEYVTTEICAHCESIERRFLFNLNTTGEAFLMYRHTIEYGTPNGDEIHIEEFAGRASRLQEMEMYYQGESRGVLTPLIIEAFSYDSSLRYLFWIESDDFWSISSEPDSTVILEKKWYEM